jgi:hypothetical protein
VLNKFAPLEQMSHDGHECHEGKKGGIGFDFAEFSRYKKSMMPRPRIFPRWFSRARRAGAKHAR